MTYRLTNLPLARSIKLDNVALVPGNLLLLKARWQPIADALPRGQALVLLPRSDSRSRRIVDTVAGLLRAKGFGITILPVERFTKFYERDRAT